VATKLIYHEKDLSHIATQSDRVLLDSPSRSQLAHSALRCLFPGLLFSPFAGAAPAGGVVERSYLRVCPLSHRALCSGAALLLFSCCCLSGVIGGGVAVSPSAQKPPAGPPPSPCSRGCLVKLRSVVVLWICIRTAFPPLGLRLRPPPAASGRLRSPPASGRLRPPAASSTAGSSQREPQLAFPCGACARRIICVHVGFLDRKTAF